MIESADISIFLMILGGTLGVLVEMNVLTNGLYAFGENIKRKSIFIILDNNGINIHRWN